MGLLNQAVALAWNTVYSLRRSDPPRDSSQDRFIWLGRTLAGVNMTHEEALRLAAVWACVTVISKSLASCRWDVFAERPNGNRELRRNTRTYRLLNDRPNPEMTAFAFREAMAIQALTWGDFMAEIEVDRVGAPLALWPLDPDRWALERTERDDLVCHILNQDRPDVTLDYADCFHVHGPGVDGIAGFDVVNVAARTLAQMSAAEQFGQAYYGNGTAFGGVLSSDQNLSPEDMEELRKSVEARHQGPDKAFRFLLLQGGLKHSSLTVPPEQGQFIETRQFLIEEVARYFGVPPHKIQHLLRSTFNNIEQQNIEFVRDALVPWAERMAQEANWKLMPDWPGFKTRIDLDPLAEGDAKSKAETDSIYVQNGIRSRNEVRQLRGLNTRSDGNADALTVQLNMTTLEKLGMEEANGLGEPDPMAPPLENAARALFHAAARRSLLRHYRQAQEAAARAESPQEFEDLLDAAQEGQCRYVADQINGVLAALNVRVPADQLKAALLPSLEEEKPLLCAAYENGGLQGWCDTEARAAALASELVELITE